MTCAGPYGGAVVPGSGARSPLADVLDQGAFQVQMPPGAGRTVRPWESACSSVGQPTAFALSAALSSEMGRAALA